MCLLIKKKKKKNVFSQCSALLFFCQSRDLILFDDDFLRLHLVAVDEAQDVHARRHPA